MKGLLVTFEGQDGSGKSTLLRLVAEELEAKKVPTLVVPEFSSNVVGEFLKSIIRKNKFLRLNEPKPTAFTETLYILADLYSQDELDIRPAIEQGRVVLKERHVDSVLACQIPKIMNDYPLEEEKRLFKWLEQASANLLEPNLTFFLQVKDEMLKDRIEARGELTDKNDFIVFRRRMAIYSRIADKKRKRWVVLNNEGSFSDSVQTIVAKIQNYHKKFERRYGHGT